MKKILCLVMSAVMLLGLMGIGASAEGTFQVQFGDVTANPGDEIEVVISLKNNPGLKGISGEVTYDTSVLTLMGYTLNATKGTCMMDSFTDDHMLMWVYDGIVNGVMQTYDDEAFMTLKFKVAENAEAGEYPVTLVQDPDYDSTVGVRDNYVYEFQADEFEIVGGTVTVNESTTPTEGFQVKFGDVTAKPGDEIEVEITLVNNPGLKGISGEVTYDTGVLTLMGYTLNATKGTCMMDSFTDDHMLMWVYDGIVNGVMQTYDDEAFMTLKFKVAEDAKAGEYPVTLVQDPDYDSTVGVRDNYVYEFQADEFEIVGGTVTINAEEPQTLENGYYLIGQKGWDINAIGPELKFEQNPNNANEFLLETGLALNDEIKVVKVENGAIVEWYPNNAGNYVVDAAHTGAKTIYFHPWYAEAWSAFGGYIWIDGALGIVAEVYGSSVSLKGNIALNFYLIVPDELKEDSGAYVMLNDTKYMINEATTRTVGDYTLYQFTISLHAKQMSDPVTLKVFTGDDEVVTLYTHTTGENVTETGYVYTVRDYIAKTKESSTDEKLIALVNAMSDYGALAQIQFNYNTENVPEIQADLSAVTAETLADYEAKVTEGTATGMSFKGTSLLLQSETVIRFYFNLDEGEIGDYTFKLGSKTVTPEESDDGWYIEIKNVAAKDLDKVYTVTVSSGAGKIVTVKGSALSYVQKVLSTDGAPEKLVNLVKGIYLYNQAANAYFG